MALRITLLDRAKPFILRKISLGIATVIALPLLIISVVRRSIFNPRNCADQGKVLVESLLPSTVLFKQNQEYVLRPLWQQAS
jgi:hypothetical protein